ncbi:kinase-like domain-containing protein [Phaeosphaeriaceae sp. PMI808]|nr:kinase-like domain-containing protein [Phaeosphaeriaceae sp. PMI808]
MLERTDFTLVRPLTSAKNGGHNRGVYLMKHKPSGKKYVEKRIGARAISEGLAAREVRAMVQCTNHPNIISINTFDLKFSRVGYGSIFMQHCELGSLDSMISRYASKREYLPDEGFLWKVFWDVSIALSHLETGQSPTTIKNYAMEGKRVEMVKGWNCIIHRDIKPGNIFLTGKNTADSDECPYPTVVLGDFGCSTTIADINAGISNPDHCSGFTPCIAPPESPRFCLKGDSYMLALTIQCLARMQNRPNMGQALGEDHPLPRRYACGALRELLVSCLQYDPRNRPHPGDLPALVLKGYTSWRGGRSDGGLQLNSWAFI